MNCGVAACELCSACVQAKPSVREFRVLTGLSVRRPGARRPCGEERARGSQTFPPAPHGQRGQPHLFKNPQLRPGVASIPFAAPDRSGARLPFDLVAVYADE